MLTKLYEAEFCKFNVILTAFGQRLDICSYEVITNDLDVALMLARQQYFMEFVTSKRAQLFSDKEVWDGIDILRYEATDVNGVVISKTFQVDTVL